MAKPVQLLEQMNEAMGMLRQALISVAQDVEEMHSLLPSAQRFVDGILAAMGASVLSSDKDASGLTDNMDIEIDLGGDNDETTLI